MSNFLFNWGFLDQISPFFLSLPPTFTHVPRFDGANITVPLGLTTAQNQPFIWSIVTVNPSIIGITNDRNLIS